MNTATIFRLARHAALALILTAAPALAAEKTPHEGPGAPSGTISMEYGQGGFLLSASGGNGTLMFRGKRYAFKTGGLGVGGIGVSKVSASGEVYNLQRIEDFPGAYFQARAGYAVGDGKGHQWLENTNGVVLKLKGKSKGLHLNLGADGLMIEMGTIKKK
ncbi:hypothetical protein NNJEOMEG_00241 [Fundidesulfovibrio magnetotacticus]|uniref:DUF1134 domain-containing protein n=1 Tax=Fundidesulfovibrio magnetotacticus TaxID=2730080 RepID=A0A6V8LRK6_9BACT|nr:hypothetical protein [Fundidesulfovibrio magnetotacticus]GFK92416.1 hypothetical protein NNJEOMEG_00241 [Fundidesulfovibrio magnetotacticus]